MKVYLISYDLVAPGRDYTRLFEAIKGYGTWCHVLESTWLVSTTQSAAQIRDHLRQFIDSNDRLFVARLSGESAWHNLSDERAEWLKKQLTAAAQVSR